MATLPRLNRLGYAGTGLGSEALNRTRDLWLLFTYSPPSDSGREELLPLALASTILFAARLLGALDDILVGYWSDRTRSRWGRRLPFVVSGTPVWLVLGFLVFVPPPDGDTAVIAIYLLVTMELYNVFSTVASGPFEALFPEVAPSNAERLKLSGLRVYFGVAGAAVGLVASGLIKEMAGIAVMAAVMAIFCLVFRIVGVAAVWNHVERDTPPATLGLREGLRATFANQQFLYFLPTFVLFGIGLSMLTGLMPYYVLAVFGQDYRLHVGPLDVELGEGAMTSLLTAVVIGSMICMVPVFARIALRRSKREAFRRALLGCSMTFPLVAVLGFLPGFPLLAQALLAMALVGAPIVGVYLFPTPLTADIIEHDASLTGMRREGMYFGAQNFVEKTAGSVSPLVLGALLLLGNTADDTLGIRLVGPAAGAVTFVGFWLFRGYTLEDDSAEPAGACLAKR